MSVPNQTPYNIYTSNGLTTVFAYEFYLISASDIQVTINGNEVTSGYTVTGVGNTGGGEVTFITAPANGATVILERVTPTYRLTDYQDNGDLLADTVNKDFDRLWMAIQRAFIYLGVALSRPLFGGGPFNADGYRISDVGAPVDKNDAATKEYVDDSSLSDRVYINEQIEKEALARKNADANLQVNIDKETEARINGDNELRNVIAANINKTIRVPENYIPPLASIMARSNTLMGFNAQGAPIPVATQTQTADLAIKLASEGGSQLIFGLGNIINSTSLIFASADTPSAYQSNGFYEQCDGGEATWQYTGNTIPEKAGTHAITEGKIYNANGDEYALEIRGGAIKVLANGAKAYTY
ncbi:phage tail fiber domain-containing protein, partial [Klebsiella pneumoniae]